IDLRDFAGIVSTLFVGENPISYRLLYGFARLVQTPLEGGPRSLLQRASLSEHYATAWLVEQHRFQYFQEAIVLLLHASLKSRDQRPLLSGAPDQRLGDLGQGRRARLPLV